MLKPSQVKQYITHECNIIRHFAIDYFTEAYILDNDIMPLLLKAYYMEKDKTNNQAGYTVMNMYQFPQTLDTLSNVYRLARNNAKNRIHFEKAIAYTDIELINNYSKPIRLSIKGFKDILNTRISLKNEDTLDLWHLLWSNCGDWGEFELTTTNLIIDELKTRLDFPFDALELILKTYKSKDPQMKELICTILIGELKLEQYTHFLIDGLRIDWVDINEEAMFALVKIGTSNVIKEIKDIYLKENNAFRIFASGALEQIKTKEAEETIIGLFNNTRDINDKTQLLLGLCNLISIKAIDLAKPLLLRGYDETLDSVERNLYAVCEMNKIYTADYEKWKSIAYKEEKKFRDIMESNGVY